MIICFFLPFKLVGMRLEFGMPGAGHAKLLKMKT